LATPFFFFLFFFLYVIALRLDSAGEIIFVFLKVDFREKQFFVCVLLFFTRRDLDAEIAF